MTLNGGRGRQGKWVGGVTHNGGGGEEEGEDGGDELEEAGAGCPRQQGSTAAQAHGLQLTCQQADSHHPQRPACICSLNLPFNPSCFFLC